MAQSTSNLSSSDLATITLGAGCFWCVEAVFEAIPGVLSGESGYSGGHIKNPGYREVCTGRTGHAEVVQLTYDVSKVSLADILEVFFATHDPTTLNRQGADVGTQYRSAIYWHNSSQVGVIEQAVELAQAKWPNSIVTEVKAFEAFYPAEDYHQAYYELNKEAPYCRAVIAPKMAKFQKEFGTRFELD
ncbi:MAG TPA: peptide-methionine (S)-S-oxide reductase [Flavobacteriales bacterium]|nr:peptide-methionine (S)-S-oxide reductase [Flavobacteriales bacterium]